MFFGIGERISISRMRVFSSSCCDTENLLSLLWQNPLTKSISPYFWTCKPNSKELFGMKKGQVQGKKCKKILRTRKQHSLALYLSEETIYDLHQLSHTKNTLKKFNSYFLDYFAFYVLPICFENLSNFLETHLVVKTDRS